MQGMWALRDHHKERNPGPSRTGDIVTKPADAPVRWTNLDGIIHVTDECCQERRCRKCGAVEHFQDIYGGYITACESCPKDVEMWNQPPIPPEHL